MMLWHKQGDRTMKKILNLILVLLLMGSIASLAFADEASDNPEEISQDNSGTQNTSTTNVHQHSSSYNETEHEIGIMNTSLGAEIRLLQLEKAIMTNLLKGVMTVQVLQGLDVNTTQLEGILADLRDVLNDVRAADPSNNTSVQVFVELKNESRNLTKQFRDTIRALLDNETIQAIKGRLQNLTSDELQNCTMKIHYRIRQFNSNQLYRLYGIIGETNTTLINEYLNGNITFNQTKFQLHKMMNQLNKEKRYMVFSECKEENITRKVQAHSSLDNMEHHGNDHDGYGNHH
jgi:hypothetical protein